MLSLCCCFCIINKVISSSGEQSHLVKRGWKLGTSLMGSGSYCEIFWDSTGESIRYTSVDIRPMKMHNFATDSLNTRDTPLECRHTRLTTLRLTTPQVVFSNFFSANKKTFKINTNFDLYYLNLYKRSQIIKENNMQLKQHPNFYCFPKKMKFI